MTEIQEETPKKTNKQKLEELNKSLEAQSLTLQCLQRGLFAGGDAQIIFQLLRYHSELSEAVKKQMAELQNEILEGSDNDRSTSNSSGPKEA
jgi:hypothetical protein